MTTPDPMSDDDLAAIDEWIVDVHTGSDGFYIDSRLVVALRDEVTRLRAREAQMMVIVRVVADEMPPLTRDMADTDFCDYCGADWFGTQETRHAADCPVTQARALLTDASQEPQP